MIFSQQCKPIINGSVLPMLNFLNEKRFDYITMERDEVISLIRPINPNNATGSDGRSGRMLLFVSTVILPL